MFPTERLLAIYDKVFSRSLLNNFYELKKGMDADGPAIERYQADALRSILDYALRHSSYYRTVLSNLDLKAGVNKIAGFDRLPILYKSTISNHINELISSEYLNTKKICFDHTGGSSGQPLRFAYDKGYKDFRWAMIYLNLYLIGYRFGDCHGFIYGSNYDSKKQYSLRQRLQFSMMNSFYVNAFFLNDRDLSLFVKKIIRKRPKGLIGYASALLQAAKFVKENKLSIRLKFIESTSEYLSAENRKSIEEAFGCSVYDRYGCREVGNIAHECEFKDGLHIDWQSVFVEIVNKGAYPWLGKDYGDIVITSLVNKGMPLIRYYMGDIGRLDDSSCRCTLRSPRLFLGGTREGDLLMAKNGGLVSSPALTLVYKDLKGVEKIQFVQPKRGEVVLKLVKNSEYSDEEDKISLRLKKLLGKDMNINFDYVDNIEKEPSGKYRIAKRLFTLNESTISK